MIKLPRKVEYGLISLIHMAELAPGAVTTAREMAEQCHLPQELLGKVLQALNRDRGPLAPGRLACCDNPKRQDSPGSEIIIGDYN